MPVAHDNEIPQKHPNLWGPFKHYVDLAMEKTYLVAKASGVLPDTWFETHEDYLGAIVDVEPFRRCIKHKGDWSKRQDDLIDVCRSHVGSRLFGPKLESLSGIFSTKLLKDECGKLRGCNITVALVEGPRVNARAGSHSGGRPAGPWGREPQG